MYIYIRGLSSRLDSHLPHLPNLCLFVTTSTFDQNWLQIGFTARFEVPNKPATDLSPLT